MLTVRVRFWNRHVKPIEGHRYEAIEPNQIDKFRRAVNAECLNGLPVIQFGKSAVTDKRGCNVKGESLVRGEVARTLSGNFRPAAAVPSSPSPIFSRSIWPFWARRKKYAQLASKA